ncbi:MAG: ribonucleoside-diphosphate reductase, partial [Clostridiales bacterium]|nr:ribonucleoside-diphosphate reductase [Clostridiales bacterium]
MEIKNHIRRFFTEELSNTDKTVFDLFDWKKVDVTLKNYATGDVISDFRDLEFPAFYSQSACDIIASKYFRKKGVKNDRGYEYSLKQIADRMVSFWVNALLDEGVITETQKPILYDELVFMLINQMWAPNSPQWFNTGLWHAYGITGQTQGHYYYDKAQGTAVLSDDAFKRTQGSACFIISINDALIGEKSLTDQLTTETLLFKYGSGVGTNWSPIRGVNEYLSGGGKSSGLISFLKVSDRNAGAIKSGGTTRRAAKMNILDLDHPEIMEFIQWKAKEEDKAAALGKMGYSTGIEGDAYETVSGQNANNSVRITDEFMQKLETGGKWRLKGRIDSTVDKDVDVDEIWDNLAKATWRCGDPGVQYDDNINAWHTCPSGEDGEYNAKHNRINASNPCSEYMFLDDSACNLASINILKFYDSEKGRFDIEGYLHCIFLIQLALEATIHWGQFPTKDIARRSYLFRTTGIGLTNIGALFMHMGLAYDSDEARCIAAALSSIMTGQSYYASACMAQTVGPFDCYNINEKYMKRVIRNHARAACKQKDMPFEDMLIKPVEIDGDLLTAIAGKKLSQTLINVWQNALSYGEKFGYRNAQVSVLAP